MLDDRKKRILQAIVDEYVNTAEPVSSGAISKKKGLDFSSATIRNEMSELEKSGYLEKTHTSSGRIPSVKGYRLYVDELLKEDNISLEEIKYIKEKLQIKANQIEDLTKIASNTLSEITHYTTVAIGPKVTKQIIKEIKFVLLGSRMLMAVILTNTGMIKETIINFGEDIYEDQIETINLLFNSKLQGKPLEKINEPLDEYIFTEMKSSASMIKTIIEQLNKVIYEESKLYLEGTNKSFDLPELSKTETARNFINILENKSEVVDLLDNEISKDINVYFGDELDDENLKDFSIVTLKSDEKDLGTIGIIGPKRMNYSKIISVMRYIQRLIDEGGK
ncbi:MAG TPA: heat-inducible transcriptional repressor HrcA [Clostridiaceae bacterium]|nr:heat-inducible transcriptional repressor HrcA [Clostridiaceae bacterium]